MRWWIFAGAMAIVIVVALVLLLPRPFDIGEHLNAIKSLRSLSYRAEKEDSKRVVSELRHYWVDLGSQTPKLLENELLATGWENIPIGKGKWYSKTLQKWPRVEASVTVRRFGERIRITAGAGLQGERLPPGF